MHSGGIEEAITAGRVTGVATLRAYLCRRIRSQGLVSASLAAAVHTGRLTVECRRCRNRRPHTVSGGAGRVACPGPRAARRLAGRGPSSGRAKRRDMFGAGTHWVPGRTSPVVAGVVGVASAVAPEHTALSLVYTTMTGSATAAQRLLALDPADVAVLTFELSALCEQTAAQAVEELADLSDPLLDVLAEGHAARERPLFFS